MYNSYIIDTGHNSLTENRETIRKKYIYFRSVVLYWNRDNDKSKNNRNDWFYHLSIPDVNLSLS